MTAYSHAVPTGGGRNFIDHELLDLHTEATPHGARWLRVCFEEWLRAAGAPATVTEDLALAVYEALANAVEHAYQPGHPQPMVHLQAEREHHQVLITISDQGCWQSRPAGSSRGRGIAVIRYLASEVDVQPGRRGTTVRLRAPLHPSSDDCAPTEPGGSGREGAG